jgi:predicted RNase H-like nuclease (RuvC/YqgF family)
MQDGFELLEEKVRKAADLVKRLRRENKALEEDVTKSKWRVQEAEKRLQTLEKEAEQQQKAGGNGEAEALAQELEALKQEREEVRRRIAKLVEVLEGLEA